MSSVRASSRSLSWSPSLLEPGVLASGIDAFLHRAQVGLTLGSPCGVGQMNPVVPPLRPAWVVFVCTHLQGPGNRERQTFCPCRFLLTRRGCLLAAGLRDNWSGSVSLVGVLRVHWVGAQDSLARNWSPIG